MSELLFRYSIAVSKLQPNTLQDMYSVCSGHLSDAVQLKLSELVLISYKEIPALPSDVSYNPGAPWMCNQSLSLPMNLVPKHEDSL